MKTNNPTSTKRNFISIEALEARIAPAAVFSFTDVDGDHVILKTSKGNNADLGNAAHVVNGQLQLLDLSTGSFGGEFAGADVTITSTRGPAGDGHVNLGYLDATGVNLGQVTIDGDLGRIHAGHGDAAIPALKGLTDLSMGTLGLTTQAAGGNLFTIINGAVGAIKVAGDLQGADLQLIKIGSNLGSLAVGGSVHEGNLGVLGNVGSVKIGGEMTSYGPMIGGSINVAGNLGTVVIGGSVAGNHFASGEISATNIGSVNIGGSLIGGPNINAGSIIASGKIGSVTIGDNVVGGGDVLAGAISSATSIGSVKIGGDLIGGYAGLKTGLVHATTTIGSISIGGDLRGGLADAGATIEAFGGAGTIKVGGSLLGGGGSDTGTIVTGGLVKSLAIAGDLVGGAKTTTGAVSMLNVKSVTIGGSLIGGAGIVSGHFGAQTVGSLVIGGDVQGSSGGGSGQIQISNVKTLAIHGSLIGGTENNSGTIYALNIQTLAIGGDVRGGSPVANNQVLSETGEISAVVLGKVTIGGSLIAGTEGALSVLNHSGTIAATERIGDLTIHGSLTGSVNQRAEILVGAPAQGAMALHSLTVDGAVVNTDVLVGYNHDKMPVSADVQVGAVKAGSWIASSLAVGVQANANNYFGDGNDTLIPGGNANIIASIASITIKGQVLGTAGAGDHYGFVAEKIGAFSISGEKLALTAAKNSFDLSPDMSVVEV